MKHERSKTVKFPVFGYKIQVVVTEDLKKSLEKRGLDPSSCTSVHGYWDGKAFSVLLFQTNPRVGTVAHECWHAVRRMLKFHEAEFENEVVAYHLGYLTQQVYDFVRSRSKQTRT